MADVTVNIRGNSSQLREELDDVQRRYGSSGSGSSNHATPTPYQSGGVGSSVPSNERMIEDVRREMRQRGVLMIPGSTSMAQIINQYSQSTREAVNDDITEKYDSKRADMRSRMSADYGRIDEDIENKRQAELKKLGPLANDPQVLEKLEEKLFRDKEEQYRIVGSRYDREEEQIDREEEGERSKAESDLTNAIKELTSYFNRRSNHADDPDSYIGQLRIQQRELMAQRDQAATEEEAMAASASLAGVNKKIMAVMGGNRPYAYDPVLQGTRGLQDMFAGMESGDLGGSIMGAAGSYAAFSGMSMTAALKFMGWVGAAVGAVKSVTNASDRYESLAGLAALRGTSGGRSGTDAMEYLNTNLPYWSHHTVSYTDLGLDREEFAAEAARRVKSRGLSDYWFDEAINQIALEKTFGLNQGSLETASKYDRYGADTTAALAQLVDRLGTLTDRYSVNTGVSNKDFTRVQEKLDIQQQIMGSWMNRSDRPDIYTANDMVVAFSSVPGITQDSRVGSDYLAFQNMIQRPVNENMRALIYSSVADLFPEAGGRMDLIDRALRNPENEGEIMSAVVRRLVQQFGGTDTQMGYFVFKNLLPDVAPDRLDEYVKAMSDPKSFTSKSLKNNLWQEDWGVGAYSSVGRYTQEAKDFQTAMSRGWNDVVDKIQNLIDIVTGLANFFTGGD